jgi:hypothetical protein
MLDLYGQFSGSRRFIAIYDRKLPAGADPAVNQPSRKKLLLTASFENVCGLSGKPIA